MYQVIVTIDSSSQGETGTTGLNVRTMADLSRTFGGVLTTVDAAELGMALALSRFVRDVLHYMPNVLEAHLEEETDFDTIVGAMRTQILAALLDGASDWVRETLGIAGDQEPAPDSDVDWNLAFKHLIQRGDH